MITITYELNGKKVDPSQIKNLLEKAILKKATEKVEAVVRSKLTLEEQGKITISVKKTQADGILFNVAGPDEIVKKINDGLQ